MPALERALYDFYVSLGDNDEDIANGGSFRGYHYMPLEIPLSVVAAQTGFKLQSGMGYERLRQLDAEGIYQWRRNGPGKPSFLSLLIWDHDEHFAALKNSRIQHVITKHAEQPKLPDLSPEFIRTVEHSGSNDVERYAFISAQFDSAGRTNDLSEYWQAYKMQRKTNV